MNNGSNGFTNPTNLISDNDGNQIHCGYVITRDLDGDGLTDFVTCNFTWHNTGTAFMRGTERGSPNDLADMEGDSLPDIINYTVINDLFVKGGQPELIGGLQGPLILDADTDGNNDIFFVQTVTGPGTTALPVKLLINDGTGNFPYTHNDIFTPVPPPFFFMGAGGHLQAADFNGEPH
ncbi:hypothetical protein N9933_02945 [bacterium]|nr:hypothetical protein [bacterium]